jgi:3-methyladenine DNA glycosylase/8-oxoguanine DNA glycosylase
VTRTVRSRLPVDLRLTLGALRRGLSDPTMRFAADGVWRATRVSTGPVTTHLTTDPPGGSVTMRAWGPGAAEALDALPALVGADDGEDGFEPGTGPLRDLHRRLRGLRIGRSGAVVEALVPSILEQKVPGTEARRSYARLVRALGEPAPGPAGLLLPPSPGVLAATPSWTFHRFGIERKRAETIRRTGTNAPRLEETVAMAPDDARRRLTALPGIGPWTAAEVALVALGDADAVSLGDYHLPDQVAWALAGEPRADDARMLELLEPWPGHRGRVIRLVVAGSGAAPRYGPRTALRSISRL